MTGLFLAVSAAVFVFLLASPFARSALWQATVTPLASIIGSGFLVSAPLLAREFGGFAAPAMLALIVLAWFIGGAIRYNIRVVEPALKQGQDRLLVSIEELSHLVLAFAYFISVAYYLSLLGISCCNRRAIRTLSWLIGSPSRWSRRWRRWAGLGAWARWRGWSASPRR
ncbi:MAG: hypothetical protein R3D85_11425 [Paracoccaceae bacterium]